MKRTRSGPKIPLEHFDNFQLNGDYESYVILSCKECNEELYSDQYTGTLSDFMMAAAEHTCKDKTCPVSPAEDSFMTNAEIQETRDAAVATGKFQVRGHPHEKIGGKVLVKDWNQDYPIPTLQNNIERKL